MTNTEALIALNMIEHVGPVRLRHLLQHFSDAAAILNASRDKLMRVHGIGVDVAEAITNWESGRFTLEDIIWALMQLRTSDAKVVGGDICGAFSPPLYARRKQRFAARMDHPKLPAPDLETATKTNLHAFNALWPILAD